MKYQALYESDGNAALKVEAPRTRGANGRIIPFPGTARLAASNPIPRRDILREDYRSQESVSVEQVPFGPEFIEARHLFYWMTDEEPAQLRARHAPALGPVRRAAYHYADRLRDAVVNHPFAVQLSCGTIAGLPDQHRGALHYAGMFAAGTMLALATALVGM